MKLLLRALDSSRSFVLRKTLSVPLLLSVFKSRPQRLFISFLLISILQFFLAGFMPVWMLVLGPLFFGLPHLFAGFRYLPQFIDPLDQSGACTLEQGNANWKWAWIFAGLAFFVACIHMGIRAGKSPIFFGSLWNSWELFAQALLVGALSILWIRKNRLMQNPRTAFTFQKFMPILWSLILLILLIYFSGRYHATTTLVVGWAHNAVAFFFWFKSARSRQERRTAFSAFGIFILGTGLLLSGQCESLFWKVEVPWPSSKYLEFWLLGKEILPGINTPVVVYRGLCAFAFSQSMHYFVWLKAIPEQRIAQQVPLSFQQSVRYTIRELGPTLATFALIFSVALISASLWFDLGLLRNSYLIGVTAHGYLEFAALPFAKGNCL